MESMIIYHVIIIYPCRSEPGTDNLYTVYLELSPISEGHDVNKTYSLEN